MNERYRPRGESIYSRGNGFRVIRCHLRRYVNGNRRRVSARAADPEGRIELEYPVGSYYIIYFLRLHRRTTREIARCASHRRIISRPPPPFPKTYDSHLFGQRHSTTCAPFPARAFLSMNQWRPVINGISNYRKLEKLRISREAKISICSSRSLSPDAPRSQRFSEFHIGLW